VGTAPADVDPILTLNPPVTAQEKQDFIKDTGRPPNSSRELYDWIVSIRSKGGYNPATIAGIPSAQTIAGIPSAQTGVTFSQEMLNPYEQLVPIVEKLLQPLTASVQQLKSGFLDPVVTIIPGTAKVAAKGAQKVATPKVATAVSAQYAQEGGAPMPVPGRALVTPMKTTKPSVMQQITTDLSNMASNSVSMNDNITTLNDNMKALLDAFNGANPSKSANNGSNTSQEGGRRRRTKVKGKRKRRGATRR
jgi:hypothetical protein